MKNLYFVSVLSLLLFTNSLFSQNSKNSDKTKSPVYNWQLTLKGGASLLWGDAASSYSPFTRWFSNEGAFTGELMLHRRLTNFLGLQIGVAKGVFSGNRDKWNPADVPHAVVTSKTDYIDYHLDVNIDFTGLFGFKPGRFLTVYAFGGVGMINYDATSYTDGKLYNSVSSNTLMIPWGGGVQLRFTPHFSLMLETSFRNTFVDDVDAYVGQGTDINDMYSITGLGLTYHFGQKKEKPKEMEVVPMEPVDTTVASNDENTVPVLANVKVDAGIPATVKSDETYNVKVVISKDSLNGAATYHQDIPAGFVAKEIDSRGGQFNFSDQVLEIKWDNLPVENPLVFSYQLSTAKLEPKTYSFEGNFVYDEDTAKRVVYFVNNASVNLPKEEIVAENTAADKVVAEKPQQSLQGIDYRVQVAAVFGGKSNPDILAKRLRLSEQIFEDPYKTGYRYTIGHFSDYVQANEHRKGVSVQGAYVVVFADGKYIGEPVKINNRVMDQNALNANGETYKVQIAASNGRPYSIVKLAAKYGLKASDIYEYKSGNWYLYSVGKFSSKEEAGTMLSEMQSKIKGAYLVHFVDGRLSNK